MSNNATTDAPVKQDQKSVKPSKPKPKMLPPFHVVLLNDDDHSYEYVIEMLRALFGHPMEKGFQLAKEVDGAGRAIVFTTHKEMAELKREQIVGFGADARIASCAGSMSAVIEPAQE
jgi:ATP-dependent Clp protease adaptor protein ClpS